MTGLIPARLADMAAAQEAAREAFEQFMDALDDRFITGYGTGEPLGFLRVDGRPPTPAEKAIAILAPHLADEPLYRSIGTPLQPHTEGPRPWLPSSRLPTCADWPTRSTTWRR